MPIPGTFSPQRAEELDTKLERNLSLARDRVRFLAGIVPGAPLSLGERGEQLVADLEEWVADQQAYVALSIDATAEAR